MKKQGLAYAFLRGFFKSLIKEKSDASWVLAKELNGRFCRELGASVSFSHYHYIIPAADNFC
ncbi:MAG: hypothetical protein LBS59_00920 [Puniceicoccales bacterium]|jgi:hypothetical protein|nr:hypothetical protein [Puniceicoccales bacterium]